MIPQKEQLEKVYSQFGALKTGSILGISKRKTLYWLHKYKISVRKTGSPEKLPEYWKEKLRKPKSRVLVGKDSPFWKPEIHSTEKVECACGCEKLINKYDKRGRRRHYFPRHSKKGMFTSERVRGEANNNWKGGVTPLNDRIRKTDKYNEWRSKVYKRDYYTCQRCKKKTRDIIAHHIHAFADYPDLRFKVDNGIALCRSCHLKEHLRIDRAGAIAEHRGSPQKGDSKCGNGLLR
ncbi:MAG: HNH endonuclease signature motif containing protein [Candidatus Aenigmarchaeota archaeon]|nr:HNH endonuclease signature motif containing protein [Candidatus Aenigmarchaeota archaeon]